MKCLLLTAGEADSIFTPGSPRIIRPMVTRVTGRVILWMGGNIVGSAELFDCLRITAAGLVDPLAEPGEAPIEPPMPEGGGLPVGQFVWIFKDPIPLSAAIPFIPHKRAGFIEIPDHDILAKIKASMYGTPGPDTAPPAVNEPEVKDG